MNEKSLIPSLRFAGFTGAWERRKLGEFVESLPFKKYIAAPTPDGKIEIIQQGNVPIIGYANGIPCDDYENITVFGDHTVSIYKPHNPFFLATDGTKLLSARSLDGDFFYFLLERYKPIPEGYKRHYTILIERYGCFPCKREQKQIAILLKHIDTLITHHQCKQEKLVNIKKAMLDKMFPKNGELFPEVRFAGFTAAWERRKLGEVTDVFRSGDFIKASDIYEDGEFPVYGGNGLRGFTNIFNYEGCYALIGRQGALCGNVNLSTGKAYFTEHAVAVHSNQANNTRFLFYLLETMNLGKYSAQSAQPGLAVGKLVELTALFPAKDEQDSIAAYLTKLDTLITLHQCKIEKLKNIKKACLEKMFV